MNMLTNISEFSARGFHPGDEVFLASGSYQGTLGIFVRFKEDVNWAEIRERDGSLRSHPVIWLQHSAVASK